VVPCAVVPAVDPVVDLDEVDDDEPEVDAFSVVVDPPLPVVPVDPEAVPVDPPFAVVP